MGAGPTPGQVRYHMNKAKRTATELSKELGVHVEARLLRASSGEAAILFYIGTEWFHNADQVRRIVNDRRNHA